MYSFLNKQLSQKYKKTTLLENYIKILVSMQPIIPHFSNECMEILKKTTNEWPTVNEEIIKENKTNIVIQINGKKRGIFQANINLSEKELTEIIKKDKKIMKYIEDKKILRKIHIKNKLLNIIV